MSDDEILMMSFFFLFFVFLLFCIRAKYLRSSVNKNLGFDRSGVNDDGKREERKNEIPYCGMIEGDGGLVTLLVDW